MPNDLNPFIHGNPVPVPRIVGRSKKIRRIVSRLRSGAQSSAVIGEPKIGKTSMLRAIRARAGASVTVSMIDLQAEGTQFDRVAFWTRALGPLLDKAQIPVRDAYAAAEGSGFRTDRLEALTRALQDAERSHWILIDEIDVITEQSHRLREMEFLGGMRSVVSRSDGALGLVVAARSPTSDLDRRLNVRGSPVFNTLAEVPVGTIERADAEELLAFGASRFSEADLRFALGAAGGHPYLLQVVGSSLWELYEDGATESETRLHGAGQDLVRAAGRVLDWTWKCWPASLRWAFLEVCLDELAGRKPGYSPGTSRPAEPGRIVDPVLQIDAILRQLFTATELRRFVHRYTPNLSGALPEEGATLDNLFDAVCRAMGRHGAITPALFSNLTRERPEQAAAIRSAANRLGMEAGGGRRAFRGELTRLRDRGFVAARGAARVEAQVQLWWMLDRIVDEDPVGLLTQSGVDHLVSADARERLLRRVAHVQKVWSLGSEALIHDAVRRAGEPE